ncbi:hypothetical protein HDU67_009555 [Dinochytrium kinnereticum]|nr:hypothetical protein HDU67_009555 [Dinochytrium kinnereticum]
MRAKVFVAADSLEAVGANTHFNTVDVNGVKHQFDGIFASDDVEVAYHMAMEPLITLLFQGYNVSLMVLGRSDGWKSDVLFGGKQVSDLIDVTRENIVFDENVIKQPTIPELSKVEVDSKPKARELLSKIARNRLSTHSSYSPFTTSIFTLTVHHDRAVIPDLWDDITQSKRSWGKLTVVEACGAELFEEDVNRLVLKEGPYLTKSVVALKNIIEFFSSTKPTSPFDHPQSILTRYLWEEFGGNRICHHVVHVSGDGRHRKCDEKVVEVGSALRRVENCPVRVGTHLEDLLVRLAAVSPYIAVILSYPMGLAMAKALPETTVNVLGLRFSLNPGPFNQKEHTLIFVFASTGAIPVYALYNIYALAGLCRRYLVRPAVMVWPANLSTVALLNSLSLKREDEKDPYSMSRFRFFWICVGVMA